MSDFLIATIVFTLVIPIALLSATIKIVPQGEEWTVEYFGRFTRVLPPGLSFLVPFAEQIGARINVRECVLDIPPQEIITKDNAMVEVDCVVFYKIFDSAKAAYQVVDLDFAITQLTMTNIRRVLGEMELDSMLSNREKINASLLSVIDEATDPWGVKVTRIEARNITPHKELQDAMSRQMKAERDKRAVILVAEGDRESDILRAEGKRKATILEAEAAKERAFLEAEMRERKAKAEAFSIDVVNTAIGKGGKASHYFLTRKYIDSMRDMANGKNNKTILMPFEATKAVGSLSFLGEMAGDFLKDGKGRKKPA